MSESNTRFSTWLQQQLNTKGLSVMELAQRARVQRSGIYHYLADKRFPDRTAVERLCAAMEIDLTTVPEFTRPPKPKAGRKSKVQ